METVLALDPGEKVGWARAVLHEDGSWSEIRHGITPLKDMALAVASHAGEYDTVVYESFRIRPDMAKSLIGSDLQTVQFIGMVRLAVWTSEDQPRLVSQGASVQSTGLKVAPAEVQKIIKNAPASHDDAHDISALAHLAYYWFQNYVPEGRQ